MLEIPNGRGIGGIRYVGEYVGNVCGKFGWCVGKREYAGIWRVDSSAF